MKTFSQIFSTVALAIVCASGFAQTNIGQDCGCPPVASRPTKNLSALASVDAAVSINDGNLLAAVTTLTCDTTWILDKQIYVPSGKILLIQAGTVIKGTPGTGEAASTLTVERGAKIIASGKEECPIIFTSTLDLNVDGSYGIENRGKWGGIVLCGTARNNAVSGYGNYVSDGVAFAEGFYDIKTDPAAGKAKGIANTRIHYGNAAYDNNDNSGILQYVSIRHAGALLSLGNEINGLTLCSVGSKTQIDHIEVVSCDDDNIELFGGTVNMKYITTVFGADDMIDSDHGWSGKAQFIFGLKATDAIAGSDDNGFEMDGGDKKTETWWGTPVIYNATMIGNNNHLVFPTGDNSAVAAICSKDRNAGELYNSVFANFAYAISFDAGTNSGYAHWIAGTNVIKNCTFIADTTLAIGRNSNLIVASDLTKFTTDGNVKVTSIPGFDYSFVINGSTNVISDNVTPTPSPALASTIVPSDPFFTAVNYRGAFKPGEKNWLSKFAMAELVKYTQGISNCPTDVDQSGITTGTDLQLVVPNLGTNCQ